MSGVYKMKIRILSDLHMEFFKREEPDWLFNVEADVLILAGDIHVGPAKLETLLTRFASHYEHVVYVFGNHEFYGYNLQSYNNIKVPSNVHIMNPGHVKIDDVTFIGGTLWTDFCGDPIAETAAKRGITDFKRIHGFDTQTCASLFNEHYKYIRDGIKILPGPKVIVTHFIPSMRCVSPYWQINGGVLNKYFAPNLDTIIDNLEDDVPLWVYGHTHDQMDQVIGNTRFIANPHGYHGYENTANFNPNLIYEYEW